MDPVEDFFNNPRREIGGAVVPLFGPPGSGKTNALIQLALMRRSEGHKVLWRGIKQAEWVNFLANGEKVTLWMHDEFDSYELKKSSRDGVEFIDFEELEKVETREWSEAETVVEESELDRINVVYVPGIEERKFEARKFFTRKMIDILDQIVHRKNSYHFVDFFTDEAGDIWPNQNTAKGELHSLVHIESPALMAQLRKQNSFLYMASHDKQDLHHMIYKVKANTIGYMQFANVVKQMHPTVDRSKVNELDRGEVIIPPYYPEEFVLAKEEQDLDWVNDSEIDMDWSYDLTHIYEDDEEDEGNPNPQVVKSGLRKQVLRNMKKDEELREKVDVLPQRLKGELIGVNQNQVSRLEQEIDDE